MKLFTLQPESVLNTILQDGVYYPPDNKVIGKKVYSIKLDEESQARSFITSPSYPEVLIIFEVDSNEVNVVDSVVHLNKILFNINTTPSYKYCEYTVDCIRKEQLVNYRIISSRKDCSHMSDEEYLDYLQDITLGIIHSELKVLSKERLVDMYDVEEQISNDNHLKDILFNAIVTCMQPDIPITDELYGKAFDIVKFMFNRDNFNKNYESNVFTLYDEFIDIRYKILRNDVGK